MTYSAVLFDVDGTLLDTREFVFSGFEHAFFMCGFAPPTREVLNLEIGRTLEQIYTDFCGPDFVDELTEHHRSFQAANLHLAVPYEGTLQTLEALKTAGFRMAAVTGRSRRTSLSTLERAGIQPFLDVVISLEDTPAVKPDPAPFRAALDALDLATPTTVAVVGDTPQDIAAGRALGAFTVAATYGFHSDAVLRADPDASISDIRELPALLQRTA